MGIKYHKEMTALYCNRGELGVMTFIPVLLSYN